MSRIASLKETGAELTQAEWERFEKAVAIEVRKRPATEPYERSENAKEPVEPTRKPVELKRREA